MPLSQRQAAWVRVWDGPRLQLAVAGLVLALLVIVGTDVSSPWSLVLLALALAASFYHFRRIQPYTRFWTPEVQAADHPVADNTLSLITANVHQPNRNVKGLLAQVNRYRPDVLVTLESDSWWEQHLDSLLPAYPHAIKSPQDNLYGMHVYSRLPLRNVEVSYVSQDGAPSIRADIVLRNGEVVRAHFVHPARTPEREAELHAVARSVRGYEGATLVVADLDEVSWSPATRDFRSRAGLLDPRVGRGLFSTFHARHAWLRWPLDHIFHSGHFDLAALRRLAPFGSDRLPVYARLIHQGRGASTSASRN